MLLYETQPVAQAVTFAPLFHQIPFWTPAQDVVVAPDPIQLPASTTFPDASVVKAPELEGNEITVDWIVQPVAPWSLNETKSVSDHDCDKSDVPPLSTVIVRVTTSPTVAGKLASAKETVVVHVN